jgi:hypothetical protein
LPNLRTDGYAEGTTTPNISTASPATGAAEPVLLIIADISGYTRYMTANAKTLAHSQTIITELVKAIVSQAELPLEVAKLEGDAVFLYCRKAQGSRPWTEARRVIGDKLLTFFQMFSDKLAELSRSSTCTCQACTHIGSLRLKVIVHSGEALFHHVFNFLELAGVDVIVVHRLLKNTIRADQYLLLTGSARGDLEFPEGTVFEPGLESPEDLSPVQTFVYFPGQAGAGPTSAPVLGESFPARFRHSWRLFFRLWFAPFFPPAASFRNVDAKTPAWGRFGWALVTLLLTPLYLPVGTLFVLAHALKVAGPRHRPGDGHVHRPDGSCCGGPG